MKTLVKVLALVVVVGFISCGNDSVETAQLVGDSIETSEEVTEYEQSGKKKRDSRTATSSGSSAANNYEN